MKIGCGVDFESHLETMLEAFGLHMVIVVNPGCIVLRFVKLSKTGSEICDFQNIRGLPRDPTEASCIHIYSRIHG
jgi:hypothetical protein